MVATLRVQIIPTSIKPMIEFKSSRISRFRLNHPRILGCHSARILIRLYISSKVIVPGNPVVTEST
jgi:hypothetical protein